MRVIQVPMREMDWPPKKRRKLRWRRARQAWPIPSDAPLSARDCAATSGAACAADIGSSVLLRKCSLLQPI